MKNYTRTKDITEELCKYTAGFFDSDGTICFYFNKTKEGHFRIAMRASCCQIDNRGRGFKLLESFCEDFGVGNLMKRDTRYESDKPQLVWNIASLEHLEWFIPKIAKHMVIKGKHFMWMLETRRKLAGVDLTEEQVKELKAKAKESRLNTGSLKPKNYPSPAWLAGYVDGDGYLRSSGREQWLKVGFWKPDKPGCDLIARAYGGSFYERKSKQNVLEYRLLLGASFYGTAKKLLKSLIPHLRLKRHDAEMILYWHKQRLNKKNSTE